MNNLEDKQRTVSILNSLKLPPGQYVIGGSGAMVLRNIPRHKPMGDLDIFVATRVWTGLYATSLTAVPGSVHRDWNLFTTDPDDRKRRCDPPYLFKDIFGLEVDIFFDWRKRGVGDIDCAMWIHNAELASGFPCVPLNILLDWKQSTGRNKDLMDVLSIREHIARGEG